MATKETLKYRSHNTGCNKLHVKRESPKGFLFMLTHLQKPYKTSNYA